MTLFELKDGRLGPASPGRPADDDATGWALAAVRHQLTEILGWPVLPISWSRIEGGDALTALDPIGQVIHLEVLRMLDASALLAAMARQAEASALNRAELSALYPGGAGIFRRDWNAFRASAPEGARPGPRLVIVTAFLAAEVRAGAVLLAGSGVEIRVLDVRMVGDGSGQERILVGVEPLRAAGAGGSTGSAGSAPAEDGGRPVAGPVAEPSPRQMPDTTVMAPTAPSWAGAPDGPTGTGVLPAVTGSGPWTPDGSTPPGGGPISPVGPGAPGGPGSPGGPGGPVGPNGMNGMNGLGGPEGPGSLGGPGGPVGPNGPGGPGSPAAPVTQPATVPVRRASGLVSPSHVIRMPVGATSPALSPSSSASVASPSLAAPPPPPPALPSEASPHAAPGDLPTAPYSVASPPREPSMPAMPAFSPSAAPSSLTPPRTTTPSRPLTPPRPMAQVAPMSAPSAMEPSPAPAAPSPIERPETSFAPSVVPPRVPTSSRSATPSRPLTPARPMPPVVAPSAVTSSPSPEGSLPSELSAASFALTMPMTTSSASSAASLASSLPSASSAAASSAPPSVPSASPSVPSAPPSVSPAPPSAISPAPPTRVGAFSDHGGAPSSAGRQAVSWLDERHESRALVEDLRGPHAVVDGVDSRDSIERRASHRSAAPVLGARPTVAPGAPAARALAVVASRVETPAALVWRSARRGINHEAVLSADGYLTLADGRRFTDPSRAADEAQHTQDTDGWRVWRLGPGGPSLGEILQSESQAPAEPRPQADSRRAQAEPRTRAELRARDQYRARDRIGA